MPVSSEPFYGGSFIQGVGSFHRTDLVRLQKNRRRLSPVQRRIVDLASLKNYKTPDSLYNALYQATQHPHLTAELVPKPLQANPATFLAASHGPETLRGLVDGPSDGPPPGGRGGPPGGPPSGKPPGDPPPGGDDRPTPPVPPGDTPPPPDERPTPPASPTRAVQTEEAPTRSRQTQAQPSTSTSETQVQPPTRNRRTQAQPSTSAGATQTPRSGEELPAPRGEAPAEDLPLRRGGSRVPAPLRHRRLVNAGRHTVGVALQGSAFAARYTTSIIYSSVSRAAYHMGFTFHLVAQLAGQTGISALTYAIVFTLLSTAEVSSTFHGMRWTAETLGVAQRPGLGDYTPLEARTEALLHGLGTFLFLSEDYNRYTTSEFWRHASRAMQQDMVPGRLDARIMADRMVSNGLLRPGAFRYINATGNRINQALSNLPAPRPPDPYQFDIVQHLRHDRHLLTRAEGLALAFANSRPFSVQVHTAFNAALEYLGYNTGQTQIARNLDLGYSAGMSLKRGVEAAVDSLTEEIGTFGAPVNERGERIYDRGEASQRRFVYEVLSNVFGSAAALFGVWAQYGRAREAAVGQQRGGRRQPTQMEIDEPEEPERVYQRGRQRDEQAEIEPPEHPDEGFLREQAQDVIGNHPPAPRGSVVADVLRPINTAVRQFDRARIREGWRQRDLSRSPERQRAVQQAIDGGLETLNEMAPNEWNNLRTRLRARRGLQPEIAFERQRPMAQYTMFSRADLEDDDPDVRGDPPDILGGDRRMRGPGLGFQDNEGSFRGRTRSGNADNPAIALTRRDE